MNHRFAVIPAAYVLFVRSTGSGDREVLLQLRSGTGYMDDHWAAAAAGHIEEGESVVAAAAREAYEELGVTELRLQPLCAMHRSQGASAIDQRVDYFLLAQHWAGEPRIQEPAKCADLRWFPLDALPSPVVPHELHVLQHYRRGTLEPIISYGV